MQRSCGVLGEHARSLGLLLDLSWAMARTDELDSLLGTVIEMVGLLTACRRISVLLPDRDHRRLRIARAVGLDGTQSPQDDLPVEDAIAGQAFMSTQTVLANTGAEAESFAKAADHFLLVQPPWASVPMCADGRVVGVLNVSDRIGGRRFSPQDAEFLSLVANHSAAAIENLLMRKSRDEAYDSVVVALAKLAEYRDDDTGKHLDRVTMYCVTLAEELRSLPQFESVIDEQFIRDLRLAAPLHDIGKVAIPDSVLLKPGKLSEAEMAVMRTHVIVGLETIKSVRARAPDSGFLYLAEEMIGTHHEWVDGAGYPNCLQGEEIPLSGRILAVADVYDALTTKRVYKDAMPHARAMEIIKQQCGTQFDPVMVGAFLRCATVFERLSRELADTVGVAARPTRAELIQRQGCAVTAK
jgi:response regulator RpfG family c-di-GMP phosphodiesterase